MPRCRSNGVGSVSKAQMIAELPDVIARFADGTFDAPYTAYPLSNIGEAWRTRDVRAP